MSWYLPQEAQSLSPKSDPHDLQASEVGAVGNAVDVAEGFGAAL
jgi:hypothetical protein